MRYGDRGLFHQSSWLGEGAEVPEMLLGHGPTLPGRSSQDKQVQQHRVLYVCRRINDLLNKLFVMD